MILKREGEIISDNVIIIIIMMMNVDYYAVIVILNIVYIEAVSCR